jgi:hypothetical protein
VPRKMNVESNQLAAQAISEMPVPEPV